MQQAHKRNLVWITVLVMLCIAVGAVMSGILKPNQATRAIQYYRLSEDMNDSKPSLSLIQTFQAVQAEGKKPIVTFQSSTFSTCEFLMFESLNNIDNIMQQIKFPMHMGWVYGIKGSDALASKSMLIHVLRATLPAATARRITPVSYIVGLEADERRLALEYNGQDGYIMKKNVQQQKGIILTRDLQEIKSNLAEFVVVQKLLEDPFIVHGKKCNMRVYILIIVRPWSKVEVYYYDDGFMYYTLEDFKPFSLNTRNVITTGLGGREMYKDKPLTHKDFAAYLGKDKATTLKLNLKSLCQYVRAAYEPILIEENKGVPGTKFLIYGMDVAPDANLDCKIMEINKGPDLTPKDERDKALKVKMMRDALCRAGLIKPFDRKDNGFIEV